MYKLINLGDFPKKIKLSERTMGFLESDVDAWIKSKIY
ncbi:MAG: helix-turn-helix transcriptional regulator [Methylobacter sp.]